MTFFFLIVISILIIFFLCSIKCSKTEDNYMDSVFKYKK